MNKITSLEQAIDLIRDGDFISTPMAGFIGAADYLVKGIEDRFLERGSPCNLTKISGCGNVSDNRLTHPGLLKRIIASHPGPGVSMMELAEKGQIEAYGLPQGILQQLYRCTASKQPGLLSKIGIGTYIDPRQDGGRLNAAAKDEMVRLVEVEGEEYLFYKAFPVNIALIRATTADEEGNLTIEQEALKLEILEAAMAAKACGGKVIAQVKYVAAAGTFRAKDVAVPAELVDAVVVVQEPEKHHLQTNVVFYDPCISGEMKRPKGAVSPPASVIDAKEVICRRAVQELFPGAVVNVGLGIGAGVSAIASSEGMSDRVTFTLELGAIGGTPTPPSDFGASLNPRAFLSHPTMFDFYHGGGLDIAFLGAAEVDSRGNVNVSKFPPFQSGRGQGGFIDISQSAKKVVFCTAFRGSGMKVSIENGEEAILQEGFQPKFVSGVQQITFNGQVALSRGQEVLYVTERCVFRLTEKGVTLIEIAPGIKLEEDILRRMDFMPIISDALRTMEKPIFIPGRMGCFD